LWLEAPLVIFPSMKLTLQTTFETIWNILCRLSKERGEIIDNIIWSLDRVNISQLILEPVPIALRERTRLQEHCTICMISPKDPNWWPKWQTSLLSLEVLPTAHLRINTSSVSYFSCCTQHLCKRRTATSLSMTWSLSKGVWNLVSSALILVALLTGRQPKPKLPEIICEMRRSH
jgi:hypothetical protein